MSICVRNSLGQVQQLRFALVAIAFVVALAGACKKADNSSIAELTDSQGPVEKDPGTNKWEPAPKGTKFVIGNGVRTGDGSANLTLRGGSRLDMQPHSLIRFGDEKKKFAVELGAVELSGDGGVDLALGRIELGKSGKVRLTNAGTGTQLDLLLGDVAVVSNGVETKLVAGKPFNLELGEISAVTIDARTAAIDAASAPVDALGLVLGEVTAVITGEKAELQASGSTTWQPLPAGQASIPPGSVLRLGAGSTARLVASGTALDLASGARVSVDEKQQAMILAGSVVASVEQGVVGRVGVPSGEAILHGEQGPAAAQLNVDGREAKVSTKKGKVELVGKGGANIELNSGDSASVSRGGEIRVLEQIPTYFDFTLGVGESAQIHDPRGSTAVKFNFGDSCPGAGEIELDRDNRFKTPRVSAGTGSANHLISGSWVYRLRCAGKAVGSGRVVVTRDSGERKLTPNTPTNPVETDGRKYSVTYQSVVPNIEASWRGAVGKNFTLFVASGGKSQSYPTSSAKFTIPGKSLKEGTYTLWFEKADGSKSKVSTLVVDFDQQAAQVYIESPSNGASFAGQIEIRGAALEGWSAFTAEGVALKLDRQRRFTATVTPPTVGALAIKFVHGKFGTHYYLRRGAR